MNLARSAIIGDDKPQRVNSDFHSSNGIVSPNWIARMGNMMKDFDLDQDTYTRVSSLTEKYGFSAEVLVMPVADSYIEFHDQNTCDLSYDELLKAIGVLCEAADLAFVDASRFASHEVEYFADPIHMTPLGREHFMHWLADRVAGRTVVHSREISD